MKFVFLVYKASTGLSEKGLVSTKPYTHELPYNQGRDAGQKYVDMLIGRCHVFNNPHICDRQQSFEKI